MKLPFASTSVVGFFDRANHHCRYIDTLTLRNALDMAANCALTIEDRAMPPPLPVAYSQVLGAGVDLRSELLPLAFFWAFEESQ